MALDLGTMYAKVELDRRDYQQGMKEIPQQAETAFKQVASLAGKWLSAQILVGGLNDWQKEFSASLNKGRKMPCVSRLSVKQPGRQRRKFKPPKHSNRLR